MWAVVLLSVAAAELPVPLPGVLPPPTLAPTAALPTAPLSAPLGAPLAPLAPALQPAAPPVALAERREAGQKSRVPGETALRATQDVKVNLRSLPSKPPKVETQTVESDAITTSTTPGMKISIDMTGFHMTAEEIRQSEDKLKQEAQHERRFEKEEIAFRHQAYQWLKLHKNDMDASVCKAGGTFFNFKVLTQLVKMGGSVNKQMCGDDFGTPLHSAAYWGLSEGVKRIMGELGADPNLCNAKGLPPVYEACVNIHGPSNKETIMQLVEGGADLNLEVEGVPLVKLAIQKGAWQVARCLLDAGASWPFGFDTKLWLHGKEYKMPHLPLSRKSSHFNFCKAAETGDTSTMVSYVASGFDFDYGLCWTPALSWTTSVLGHAAFHRQTEAVELLHSWNASKKKSEMCLEKKKTCSGTNCFECFSACEAYKSHDVTLTHFKKDWNSKIAELLDC